MSEKEKEEEDLTLEEMLKTVPEDYIKRTKDVGLSMEEIEEVWADDSWMDNQPTRCSLWDCGHKNTEEIDGNIVCKDCGLTLEERE